MFFAVDFAQQELGLFDGFKYLSGVKAPGVETLSISQQLRAGMALNRLYKRHALVRWYVSLLLKIAPRRYRQLLEIKRKAALMFILIAICAIGRLK